MSLTSVLVSLLAWLTRSTPIFIVDERLYITYPAVVVLCNAFFCIFYYNLLTESQVFNLSNSTLIIPHKSLMSISEKTNLYRQQKEYNQISLMHYRYH